ncbi:ERF family protein [Bradyrhizobium sp. AUGA SZCCT0431]|uniref:ERF family protein n=1 Tax=Bradyrhizobium sp. AUGA SZCCT0431 TaxID=2807674 RepID=UPI001BADB9A3|nr:ERF family protein [Bradyrhizobium sp. AUGA SZCCT0431]MBR1146659.1 ERF family protein [Bradyrhizobium sp. AUGA SZCCT0431]
METSPEIKNIATALLNFQADAPTVTKDAKANYGRYATLGNVIDSTRATLATYGLSFMQFPDGDGLTTIIMHKSGEWIRATGKLILDKQTAQGLGSALTYSRRYGLTSALGIAADDDDDGAHAVTAPQTTKKAPPAKEDPTLGYRLHIAALMAELGHKERGQELIREITKITDLPVTDQNLPDIIARLEATLGK